MGEKRVVGGGQTPRLDRNYTSRSNTNTHRSEKHHPKLSNYTLQRAQSDDALAIRSRLDDFYNDNDLPTVTPNAASPNYNRSSHPQSSQQHQSDQIKIKHKTIVDILE